MYTHVKRVLQGSVLVHVSVALLGVAALAYTPPPALAKEADCKIVPDCDYCECWTTVDGQLECECRNCVFRCAE